MAGFSTFGEILGINLNENLLNENLTALAFFDSEDRPFHDDLIDNFTLMYSRLAQTRW